MKVSSLTREDLAYRWLITPHTLDRWRRNGKGPQFFKTDEGVVSYKIKDVEEFEERNTVYTNDSPIKLNFKRHKIAQ